MLDELGAYVDVRQLDDQVTVVACGEIDMATAPQLEAAVTRGEPARRYVFDLSGVTFMDSSGLKVLAVAAARTGRPSDVVVRGATGPVRRVLEISGLDQHVRLDDAG